MMKLSSPSSLSGVVDSSFSRPSRRSREQDQNAQKAHVRPSKLLSSPQKDASPKSFMSRDPVGLDTTEAGIGRKVGGISRLAGDRSYFIHYFWPVEYRLP